MAFQLTDENYYSDQANFEYMSVSQYKDFAGTFGKRACEAAALAKCKGEWREESSTAMMVGSYVDAYFEGTLDRFKALNPSMFRQDGGLKSPFIQAERCIARAERDELFMKYMSGEKQVIMTGNLFGTPWKIKIDSYIPGTAIVDLKVMESLTKLKFVRDLGYLEFVRYWGYDIQGAIYREIVYQNTGSVLPFYIAGISKEAEPDLRLIRVKDIYLREALSVVESNMPHILKVKYGEVEPERCDYCPYCNRTRVLTSPIDLEDLAFQ